MKSTTLQSILTQFATARPHPTPTREQGTEQDTSGKSAQATEPSPIPPPIPLPSPTHCPRCGNTQHWQPRGADTWYCTTCDPAPNASMIGAETGTPRVIGECAYAVGRMGTREVLVMGNLVRYETFLPQVVCTCGSHHVTETTWTDGIATYECSSCGAGIQSSTVAAGTSLQTSSLPTA